MKPFPWWWILFGAVLVMPCLLPGKMDGANATPLPLEERIAALEKENQVLRGAVKRQTANYTELQSKTTEVEAQRKEAWDAYRASETKRRQAEVETMQAMELTQELVARLDVVEAGFDAACNVGWATATELLLEARTDRESLVLASTEPLSKSHETLRQRLSQSCNEKMARASRLMRIFEKDGGPPNDPPPLPERAPALLQRTARR